MDAGVVEQVSLGKEIEGEINRIFSLPVTEGRAIVRAAEVFGVDASTTSFQDLGQLKDVILKRLLQFGSQ